MKTTQFSPMFKKFCPRTNGSQQEGVSVEFNRMKCKTLTPTYRAFDDMLMLQTDRNEIQTRFCY